MFFLHVMGRNYGLKCGSYMWQQLSAAGTTNRPQPKVVITKVMIKPMLWLAAGCNAKLVAELGSRT